jgi:hypothetical protein
VNKQVRRPRNRALLYDARDFALRSATGPILDDVHRSEGARLKAIELAATQDSEIISIERKALLALLLAVPCRADDCAGRMDLITITEHGEQGKYLLQCNRCSSSKTFLTHKETGLVMAKIPPFQLRPARPAEALPSREEVPQSKRSGRGQYSPALEGAHCARRL